MLVFATAAAPLAAGPPAAEQKLDQAIQLYGSRAYEQAQDLLAAIDRADLPADKRRQRAQYVALCAVAIDQVDQAHEHLKQGRAAVGRSEFDVAKKLLADVLQNEFAPAEVKNEAHKALSSIARYERRDVQLAAAPGDPGTGSNAERAESLIRQGREAMARGDYQMAHDHFEAARRLVPGHPDAVSGLEQLELHQRVTSGGPDSVRLIDRIRQRRAILWQRAVAAYRQAEREVYEYVDTNRYAQAQQTLRFARETIEAARQYAEPLSDYDALKAEYEALSDMVDRREQQYNEQQASDVRVNLEVEERTRLESLEADRQRQIDLLMEQVDQKKEDRDYEGAVQVLRQVKVIDPKNIEAEWLMEQLEDLSSIFRQNQANMLHNRETRELLIQAEESKIPWHKELNYPDNWQDILRSPYRRLPGDVPLDGEEGDFEQSFQTRIPEISFRDAPLNEALSQIAEVGDVNVVPNWRDLALAGVTPDTRVSLELKDVPLKTVLTEVLEQVESLSATPIGYALRAGGIVKVASEDFLNEEVHTRVYYVTDLIHPAENFDDAPDFNLEKRRRDRERDRRELRFAGNRRAVEDREEAAPEDPRNPHLADLINLIQEHVMPGSWKSQGGSHATMHARSDGNLVVTQTSRGHQQLFNLLNQLREDSAVQIAIEARFLTVNHNFLEDMGIDLNIVLNNGNAGFDAGSVGGAGAFDPASGGRLLLPRQFGRLGITPSVPAFGTPTGNVGTPDQPFVNPAFVPSNNGSGNFWTPVPINTNLRAYTSPAALISDVPGSFAGRDIPPALQIAGSFLDNIQVDFLIRATQADSRTNTLIAPKLVMTNGQQSWIAITEQQNFVSQLDPQVASGAAAQAPVIDVINSGAVLNVQAVVSPDRRYVTMNLQPGVGRLVAINTFQFTGGPVAGVGTEGFVQLPILQVQNVKTTVTVPDGGTLLIGGQKLTFETQVEAGVPVLSKIPVLKRLYSNRTDVKDEQVLLIMIKPQILIKEEQEELAHPLLGAIQ